MHFHPSRATGLQWIILETSNPVIVLPRTYQWTSGFIGTPFMRTCLQLCKHTSNAPSTVSLILKPYFFMVQIPRTSQKGPFAAMNHKSTASWLRLIGDTHCACPSDPPLPNFRAGPFKLHPISHPAMNRITRSSVQKFSLGTIKSISLTASHRSLLLPVHILLPYPSQSELTRK